MKKLFSMGIVLSTLIVSISSCKKDGAVAPGGGTNETPKNDINLTNNATLGRYMSNKQGLTLYMFANDADGGSSCTGGCETTWPAFTADLTTAKLDAGLAIADFGIIVTASGKRQVTYKGWPLYTYSPAGTDGYGNSTNVAEAPGQVKGDGFAGVWFIAKPDYTIMFANKQLTGLDSNNYKSDYTLGNGKTVYFTNDKGGTLYNFKNDSFNINKYTKADLSNNDVWPIYGPDEIVLPSVLDKTLFANITVGGRKQLTYKGWPLYNFGRDNLRGLNQGVSVGVPGTWPVAVKDVIEARR